MRERVGLVNGTIAIRSQASFGTEIAVHAPSHRGVPRVRDHFRRGLTREKAHACLTHLAEQNIIDSLP